MPIRQWILASLACGATQFAIGAAFHFLVPILVPSLPSKFLDEALFRSWLEIRVYMALHPFIYGFLFVAPFIAQQRRHAVGASVGRGASYGVAVFLVGHVPVYLLTFSAFQVPAGIITCWLVQSLLQCTVSGMVIGMRPLRVKSA